MKRILLALFLFASFAVIAQPPHGHFGQTAAPAVVPSPFSKVSYTPSTIVLNITDVKINKTVLKRTATFATMVYNQKASTLALNWTVKYYATDSLGNYGAYLGGIISDVTKSFIAANTTMVNPATGQVLTPDANGNYSMNYIGQYDFFNGMAGNTAVKVNDVIRQYGVISDWN